MDRFFDWPLSETGLLDETRGWHPHVDVYEDDSKVVLKADLPGLEKKEIDVHVEDNILTLKGTKKREEEVKEKNFHRCERIYGTFERVFELASTVDAAHIKAEYKNGVLTVSLPKTEEAKPKRIDVGVN